MDLKVFCHSLPYGCLSLNLYWFPTSIHQIIMLSKQISQKKNLYSFRSRLRRSLPVRTQSLIEYLPRPSLRHMRTNRFVSSYNTIEASPLLLNLRSGEQLYGVSRHLISVVTVKVKPCRMRLTVSPLERMRIQWESTQCKTTFLNGFKNCARAFGARILCQNILTYNVLCINPITYTIHTILKGEICLNSNYIIIASRLYCGYDIIL